MIPCAETNYVPSAWFFREAILSLMLQENIGTIEVAARLGMNVRSVQRYIKMTNNEAKKARPHQYPQQFLIGLMLDENTVDRLKRSLPWHNTRRAPWLAASTK